MLAFRNLKITAFIEANLLHNLALPVFAAPNAPTHALHSTVYINEKQAGFALAGALWLRQCEPLNMMDWR
jgi:hypothetical protein